MSLSMKPQYVNGALRPLPMYWGLLDFIASLQLICCPVLTAGCGPRGSACGWINCLCNNRRQRCCLVRLLSASSRLPQTPCHVE